MSDANGRLRIKDLAEEDRPREKMLAKGPLSLSDAELVAILIGSGNQECSAVELAQQILSDEGYNLNTLGKRSISYFKKYKGIGEAKAVAITAALELGRRRSVAEPPKRSSIRTSNDIFQLFYRYLCDLTHEELWVAFLTGSLKVIEKKRVSEGVQNSTGGCVNKIIKAAIEATCSGIILCHNHPSGNLTPSLQDDNLTSTLSRAAQLVDMKLIDHLIISDNHYYSYADENRLDNGK
ncbi:MAG: DNA repair protein RadC [Tannerella sp.]|jgi:DNA repair protein RadC|nr:DNA repair protein RadC [Tannerella sp.]